MISDSDRFCGCLVGLAAGDALGTTVEFSSPGTFRPLQDIVGGGPFKLEPGQWTDDTSMALCLAESLVRCQGFNPVDQMQRYLRWYHQGYLSSNGRCFDIGITVQKALALFERTGELFSGSTDLNSAGNGSIMRLAPVVMFFTRHPDIAIQMAAESSRTTHAATAAVDACKYLAGLLFGALHGTNKAELLSKRYCPIPSYWEKFPLVAEIDEVACGSFKHRQPPEIKGIGYVVRSLEAALWAFFNSESFREGCLLAVNLGDDADTTGAVYGQLAGAYYGLQSIPQEWLAKIALRTDIEKLAGQLLEYTR